jgi:hypothetical protein
MLAIILLPRSITGVRHRIWRRNAICSSWIRELNAQLTLKRRYVRWTPAVLEMSMKRIALIVHYI